MATKPIDTTNTLLSLPPNLCIAGILRMAYIGIMNRIIAIIGPPKASINPKMLGFMIDFASGSCIAAQLDNQAFQTFART